MSGREDATAVYEAACEFAEEGANAAALEALLATDAEADGPWMFADVGLDSGRFGEAVASGIVTREGDAYRLADREAVRAALDGEAFEPDKGGSAVGVRSFTDLRSIADARLAAVDRAVLIGLLGALALLVGTRLIQFRSVFQQGQVVSPANDQYYFRYRLHEMLDASSGVTDYDVLIDPAWATGWNQRPLTYTTHWFFVEALGGGQWAINTVVAWLPIVFTVLSGLLLYGIAVLLTDDVRVGIASVVVLALAPIHVVYTQVGFFGHRAHQYLWFCVLLFAMIWLVTDLKRRAETVGPGCAEREHCRAIKTWGVALVLALGVAAWTHSWGGSAELFIGLVAYVGVKLYLDVRHDLDPARANAPILVGLGLGTGIATLFHIRWAWHGELAVGMAVAAFTASTILVTSAAIWYRLGLSANLLLGIELLVLAIVAGSVYWYRPSFVELLRDVFERQLRSFGGYGSTQSGSLYTTETFPLWEPIAQLGLTFYIAIAALIWCCWIISRRYEPGWLLISVLTVHYAIAAGFLVRFAGRLAIVMAVLAGVAIVFLYSKLDLARPLVAFGTGETDENTRTPLEPRLVLPDLRSSGWILGVGILLFGVSLLYVPALTGQTAHDESHVEAALVIEAHAVETDREYPEDHVFAPWGEYRMYNYFVSGESFSEGLGRNHYPNIYSWTEQEDALDYLNSRAGYVVVTGSSDTLGTTVHSRLTEEWQDGPDESDPLERFQLLYVDHDAEVAAFAVVEGADLEITGEEDAAVFVETSQEISGHTYTYDRTTRLDENGTATMTVPYPGEYQVGETAVTVSTADVEEGQTVTVDTGSDSN